VRCNRWLSALVVFSLLCIGFAGAGVAQAPQPAGQEAAAAAFPVWQTEFAVNPSRAFAELSSRSLAFDSADHPHIAYGGDHLYHAWHDGSSWHTETVDAAWGVGRWASIAIDSGSGYPRIAYYDAVKGNLKYAYRTAAGWTCTDVNTHGDVGQYCSLALDPVSRYPRISYYDVTNSSLCVAIGSCPGGGCTWSTTSVDSAGDVGQYTSIVAEAGKVHVAYRDVTNQCLKYAWWDGSWHTPEQAYAYSGGDSGYFTSIAIDTGFNRPCISHYDQHANKLLLSMRNYSGPGWSTESTSLGGYRTAATTSLLFDGGGAFHIVTGASDGSQAGLRDYPYEYGYGWVAPSTLVAGDHVYGAAAVLGPGNQLRVGYLSFGALGTQRLRYYAAGSPAVTVDQDGEVGWAGNALALDPAGRPHIAYYDAGHARPGYATRQAAGTWTSGLLSGELGGGIGASLAFDAQGRAHVSYYTSAAQMRYAHQEGATWQVETVGVDASPDPMDSRTSLVLDASSGQPRIAFTRNYPYDLYYASYSGASWSAVAPTGSPKGLNPSLALDAAGQPHIAYLNNTRNELMYTYRVCPPIGRCSWYTETVAAPFGYLNPPALAFAPGSAQPSIAYYDEANGDLVFTGRVKLPNNGPIVWFPTTVDSAGDVGAYPSLAFDAQGTPHITYYDATNGNLKHAWRVGSTWYTQIVDSGGDVGTWSSLAAGPCGSLHVSYYDATNRALKYAYVAGSCAGLNLPLVLRRH
jgi:hypothetical protein